MSSLLGEEVTLLRNARSPSTALAYALMGKTNGYCSCNGASALQILPRRRDQAGLFNVVPMTPQIPEPLLEQRKAFIEKFGRDPTWTKTSPLQSIGNDWMRIWRRRSGMQASILLRLRPPESCYARGLRHTCVGRLFPLSTTGASARRAAHIGFSTKNSRDGE